MVIFRQEGPKEESFPPTLWLMDSPPACGAAVLGGDWMGGLGRGLLPLVLFPLARLTCILLWSVRTRAWGRRRGAGPI